MNVLLQRFGRDFLFIVIGFPNVAHHATAIAPAVRHHYEYRKVIDSMRCKVQQTFDGIQ